MMKRTAAALVIVLVFGVGLYPRTLWVEKNPYATDAKLKIGDIVVVDVEDISTMQFDLAVNDRNSFIISSVPDKNITGFLPKVESSRKVKGDQGSRFASKGKIRFSLATRIVKEAGAKAYAIAGKKTLIVNGSANIISVTGVVDPSLIKGRNINSESVADFSLEIQGAKVGMKIARGKLKEDEQATAELTEEERQRIIVDYLEKMIGELMR